MAIVVYKARFVSLGDVLVLYSTVLVRKLRVLEYGHPAPTVYYMYDESVVCRKTGDGSL